MKLDTVLCLGLFGVVCAAQADTFTRVITPPSYTDVQRSVDGTPYYFHDDQWAAIVFLRLPSCVPADFDLLDGAEDYQMSMWIHFAHSRPYLRRLMAETQLQEVSVKEVLFPRDGGHKAAGLAVVLARQSVIE